MSIADNLKLLADTKWAFREAIEAKGIPVASTDLFSSYPEKIKQLGSANRMHDPGNTYRRPIDWLPLPDISDTEEKFVGLCAVFENKPSIVSINMSCPVDIDWGDGTTSLECYPGSGKMMHTYDYNSLPDSSICSRGYKQAIVTIKPSADAGMGFSCLFLQYAASSLGGKKPVQYWLDIKISSPSLCYMSISDNTPEKLPLLEQFSIISDNQIGTLGNTFEYLYGLKCIPLLVCNNVSNFSNAFYYCLNLVYANITKADNCSNFGQMFSCCSALKKVDGITFQNKNGQGVYANMAFSSCYNLEYIPEIKFDNGSCCELFMYGCASLKALPPNTEIINTYGKNMFQGCTSLKTIDGLKITGGNYTYMFEDCSALEEIHNLTLSAQSSLYLENLFFNCYNLKSADIKIINPEDGALNLCTNGMFNNCTSLKYVSDLDTSSCNRFDKMFYYCKSLEKAPQMDTSNGTIFTDMFNNCVSLKEVPQYDFEKAEWFDGVFSCCSSIREFGDINIPIATTIERAFTWCGMSKLNLTTSTSLTNASGAFGGCFALEEVDTPIDATYITEKNNFYDAFENSKLIRNCPFTNIRTSLDLTGCSLESSALITMFNNLGTPYSSSYATITITGNPGVSALTSADKAIATNKGWTLVM